MKDEKPLRNWLVHRLDKAGRKMTIGPYTRAGALMVERLAKREGYRTRLELVSQ